MNYFKNKHIPFYFLYDAKGSEYFDMITKSKEYYPFSCENELILKYAEEMLSFKDDLNKEKVTCVEFGAGYSEKTETLIKVLLKKFKQVTFVPIDVSESACEITKEKYSKISNLQVIPYVGTYDMFFDANLNYEGRVVYLFLGSSIGNYERGDQITFLNKVSSMMNFRDICLIGFDTIYKDSKIILNAYNDESGLSRDFMLNILNHVNEKFGTNSETNDFSYDVKWSEEEHRVEMGLLCKRDTTIEDKEGDKVEIKEGDRIHVEYSHKFSVEILRTLADNSNLLHKDTWFSPDKYYMFSSFIKSPKKVWEKTSFLFKDVIGYDNLHLQPIKLRNPLVFYLAHIQTFYDIRVHGLKNGLYFDLFERGRDPLVTDPEKCHRHSEVSNSYPSLETLLEYVENVKERTIKYLLDNGYQFNMITSIHHELMHQETLVYIIRMMSIPLTVSLPEKNEAKAKQIIHIPKRQIIQGTNESHWDNETPAHLITVEAFKVDNLPVTWGEMEEFIKDNIEFARKNIINIKVDEMMIRITEATWIPFEQGRNLPAWVNIEIAQEFITWLNKMKGRNCRLMTEDEFDSAASMLDSIRLGNVNFKHWHATPIGFYNDYSKDGVGELFSNGWELTSTVFRPYEGFKCQENYPEYSQDFFTDYHYVLKGASPFTSSECIRKSFRNWYQYNYMYHCAKFRLIHTN